MSVIRKLQAELQQVETAQFVTTMLRDISATRLASIRATFEANEAYFTELHGLMDTVKQYAAQRGIAIADPAQGRVYVAVTANKRFYGSLNAEVMAAWHTQYTAEADATGVVVGLTGHQWLERLAATETVQQTRFANDTPTAAELVTLVEALEPFADVRVVHPTFINSFRQEPKTTDLTHAPVETDTPVPAIEYICEPELPELLAFFRTHIRLTLLRRALLETRLALTGARLMKMQRARERSVELVGEQQQTIHNEMRTIESMRLLETSMSFHRDLSL